MQVRQDFFDLLNEQHIEGSQRWSKVKERLETDSRYKAVESSALREELFKQYLEKQAKVGPATNVSVVAAQDARTALTNLNVFSRIGFYVFVYFIYIQYSSVKNC